MTAMIVLTILLIQLMMTVSSDRVCEVLVGVDEPLFNKYDKNISFIVNYVEDHFDGVNQIFKNNKTGPFKDKYSDLRFKVKRVQVMFGSCDTIRHVNCTQNREAFLQAFDDDDFSQFCLAYMFTYL